VTVPVVSQEVSGGRVRIIGADPEGSVYSGGSGGRSWWKAWRGLLPHLRPGHLRRDHRGVRRRLVRHDTAPRREERCCPAAPAAWRPPPPLRLASDSPDDVVVVLLPDGGRGYLSKVFNDRWMSATVPAAYSSGARSAMCFAPQGREHAHSCTRTPTRRSGDAVGICASSVCPRCRVVTEPRSWPRGGRAVIERQPARPAVHQPGQLSAGLTAHVAGRCHDRRRRAGQRRDDALSTAEGPLVLVDGKPAGWSPDTKRARLPRRALIPPERSYRMTPAWASVPRDDD